MLLHKLHHIPTMFYARYFPIHHSKDIIVHNILILFMPLNTTYTDIMTIVGCVPDSHPGAYHSRVALEFILFNFNAVQLLATHQHHVVNCY